jgi:hypothetical protein
MTIKSLVAFSLLVLLTACQNASNKRSSDNSNLTEKPGTYGYDLAFLRDHLEVIELSNGESRLVVVPEYQGRIMTSSSSGMKGFSYGWVNYDLISSGKILDDFNPFGGEERIWLGPEGGQFSLYFREGESFKDGKWIVPAPFDREPFSVEKKDSLSVTLGKTAELKNYSGTIFNLKITRTVTLLNKTQISKLTGIRDTGVEVVGYQSENRLKNTGKESWDREKGALSIWMLTMFTASPEVTVILPYRKGAPGPVVKDDYLGKMPEDRLKTGENAVYFRADANYRSKIGMSPARALPLMGSYDSRNNILTVVEYSMPEGAREYVNSALEIQKDPFSGDVINSYNDGPKKDGSRLGNYYELEDSSPAAFLKPGEEIIHTRRVYHFKGSEKELDILSNSLLKVSLEKIRKAFSD